MAGLLRQEHREKYDEELKQIQGLISMNDIYAWVTDQDDNDGKEEDDTWEGRHASFVGLAAGVLTLRNSGRNVLTVNEMSSQLYKPCCCLYSCKAY